jgi:anaerobic ribonucleoside-triphosphate reductase activating protein
MSNPTEEPTMPIAQVVRSTEAEGPGRRFAIWFQGCPLRCPGCCNPEFLPFTGGQPTTATALAAEMRVARDEAEVEGITLLGGEPFAHTPGAVALAAAAQELGLSVMVFSGFTLGQLREQRDRAVEDLLARTDILVDGPYLREQPDTERRWVGSRNQVIHFLTSRYSFDDQWRERNTLEIRVRGGEITVNGFPARDAVGLWKGWKRTKPSALRSAPVVSGQPELESR